MSVSRGTSKTTTSTLSSGDSAAAGLSGIQSLRTGPTSSRSSCSVALESGYSEANLGFISITIIHLQKFQNSFYEVRSTNMFFHKVRKTNTYQYLCTTRWINTQISHSRFGESLCVCISLCAKYYVALEHASDRSLEKLLLWEYLS